MIIKYQGSYVKLNRNTATKKLPGSPSGDAPAQLANPANVSRLSVGAVRVEGAGSRFMGLRAGRLFEGQGFRALALGL